MTAAAVGRAGSRGSPRGLAGVEGRGGARLL